MRLIWVQDLQCTAKSFLWHCCKRVLKAIIASKTANRFLHFGRYGVSRPYTFIFVNATASKVGPSKSRPSRIIDQCNITHTSISDVPADWPTWLAATPPNEIVKANNCITADNFENGRYLFTQALFTQALFTRALFPAQFFRRPSDDRSELSSLKVSGTTFSFKAIHLCTPALHGSPIIWSVDVFFLLKPLGNFHFIKAV